MCSRLPMQELCQRIIKCFYLFCIINHCIPYPNLFRSCIEAIFSNKGSATLPARGRKEQIHVMKRKMFFSSLLQTLSYRRITHTSNCRHEEGGYLLGSQPLNCSKLIAILNLFKFLFYYLYQPIKGFSSKLQHVINPHVMSSIDSAIFNEMTFKMKSILILAN